MLRQLSVFIENNQGSLADLTMALERRGIVIHALALADASRFGVVRAIVAQPDQALEAMASALRESPLRPLDREYRKASVSRAARTTEGRKSSSRQ